MLKEPRVGLPSSLLGSVIYIFERRGKCPARTMILRGVAHLACMLLWFLHGPQGPLHGPLHGPLRFNTGKTIIREVILFWQCTWKVLPNRRDIQYQVPGYTNLQRPPSTKAPLTASWPAAWLYAHSESSWEGNWCLSQLPTGFTTDDSPDRWPH